MTPNVHQFRKAVPAGAFALSWLLAWAACAEDWPQWRGPNRDAVWNETNVLQTFPTNGLKIRWRASIGFGYSSPVVAQGHVFVTDSQLKKPKASERILCFDETSGQSLWVHSHDASYPDWAFTPGQEMGPTATPIIQNGKIYALDSVGQIFCVETSKGRVVWKKNLAQAFASRELLTWRASPLIEGNLLIVLCGGDGEMSKGCLVALDKSSGKEIWRAVNERAQCSSPIIITAGGVQQLIVWTPQSVTSLNPATGKLYWRERLLAANDSPVSTPVFRDSRLLVGGLMFKLDAREPTASVLWPVSGIRKQLSDTSTALLRDEHVFSAKSSGELVCLDAGSGKQIWTTNSVTDQKSGASIHITVNGDSVLLFNDRGELIRARLAAQGYHEISRAALIQPTSPFGGRKVAWTPPAFANHHVFARSDKELISASLEAKP